VYIRAVTALTQTTDRRTVGAVLDCHLYRRYFAQKVRIAPTIGTATAGNASVSVAFKAPATAILNFFSSQPDFPPVAGDMAEEFQLRGRISGTKAAERWYWNEAFRNAWALTAREIYRTPARTIIVAFGCLVAVNILTGFYFFITFYPRSVDAFLSHFRYVDPTEFVQYRTRRDFALMLQFIAPLAMGWIGSRRLPGREWALMLVFTFVSACAALPPAWYLLVNLRIVLPTPVWEFMAAEFAFRLSGFWLGSLWIRTRIAVE
jgi:hypothetical protein